MIFLLRQHYISKVVELLNMLEQFRTNHQRAQVTRSPVHSNKNLAQFLPTPPSLVNQIHLEVLLCEGPSAGATGAPSIAKRHCADDKITTTISEKNMKTHMNIRIHNKNATKNTILYYITYIRYTIFYLTSFKWVLLRVDLKKSSCGNPSKSLVMWIPIEHLKFKDSRYSPTPKYHANTGWIPHQCWFKKCSTDLHTSPSLIKPN